MSIPNPYPNIADKEINDVKTWSSAKIVSKLQPALDTVTTEGENLYNKKDATLNCYLDSDGNLVASTSWRVSGYISVNNTYMYNGLITVGLVPMSCYYDEDKHFISSFKQATGKNYCEISENIKYVRFSISNSVEDYNNFEVYQTNTIENILKERGILP